MFDAFVCDDFWRVLLEGFERESTKQKRNLTLSRSVAPICNGSYINKTYTIDEKAPYPEYPLSRYWDASHQIIEDVTSGLPKGSHVALYFKPKESDMPKPLNINVVAKIEKYGS